MPENDFKTCFAKLLIPFIVLKTFRVKLLLENSLWRSILIYLKTKVTPQNPLFWHFVQYGPEEVRVLINLIFLKFWVSKEIKNPLMLPATIYFLHFWAAIMDFLIIFKFLVFSSNDFVGYVLQIKMQLKKP